MLIVAGVRARLELRIWYLFNFPSRRLCIIEPVKINEKRVNQRRTNYSVTRYGGIIRLCVCVWGVLGVLRPRPVPDAPSVGIAVAFAMFRDAEKRTLVSVRYDRTRGINTTETALTASGALRPYNAHLSRP